MLVMPGSIAVSRAAMPEMWGGTVTGGKEDSIMFVDNLERRIMEYASAWPRDNVFWFIDAIRDQWQPGEGKCTLRWCDHCRRWFACWPTVVGCPDCGETLR